MTASGVPSAAAGPIAFDADVLIYAAAADHPLGSRVRRLFPDDDGGSAGVGSVLLLAEILAKPMRENPQSPETAVLLGKDFSRRIVEIDVIHPDDL